jgi:hypothetical protein
MIAIREAKLLRTFRLCRADIVAALSSRVEPPTSMMLKELAELQLVIMATEAAIADKTKADFLKEFEDLAAA